MSTNIYNKQNEDTVESRINNNNENVAKDASTPPDLNLIRSLIVGHYKSLKNHKEYLATIERFLINHKNGVDVENQSGVTIEQISDYLNEQGFPLINDFTLMLGTIVPGLQKAIDRLLTDFQDIYKAAKTIEDEEKAIILMAYLLHFENVKAAKKEVIQSLKSLSLETKLATAYTDSAFYQQLEELINSMIPPSYLENFQKVFQLQEVDKQSKDINIGLKTRWDLIDQDLVLRINRRYLSNDVIKRIQDFRAKLKQRFEAYLVFLQKQNYQEGEILADLIKDVDFFLAIQQDLQFFDTVLPKEVTQDTDPSRIERTYNFKTKEVNDLTESWQTAQQNIKSLITDLKKEVKDKDLLKEIANASTILAEINDSQVAIFKGWPQALPLNLKSKQDIDQIFSNIDHAHRTYCAKANDLKDQLKDIRKKQQLLNKASAEKANKTLQENLEKIKANRQALQESLKTLKQTRADDLNLFRSQQTAKKEQRAKQQKEARKNARATFFQPTVERFLNQVVHQTVLSLHPHKLNLIRKILINKEDVYYDEVINLIVNDLHGKLVKFGSAHERILIDKYIIQLPSKANNSNNANSVQESEIIRHSVATGGILNPHQGEQHNPGILSPCSVDLVRKTFIKAEITLELIDKIELGETPVLAQAEATKHNLE